MNAPAPTPPAPVAHRPIRSFVRRAGRVSDAQARARQALSARWVVPYQANAIDWIAAYADPASVEPPFDAQSPLVFEIGFGMGETSAAIAAALPGTRFIGCEVHEPGIGALLKRIHEQGLRNQLIVAHDAVEVLRDMIAPASLDGVHIFFPDPWHKKRHHKRRLIQPPLVSLLASRLKAGGYIHCATDWQDYAEQMLAVLSAEPLLRNQGLAMAPEGGGYAPRPAYRPVTKFERRGLKLGHGVWDLVFVRV